jgi:hypothetical protein
MVALARPETPAVRSLRSVDVLLALLALTGGLRVVSLALSAPATGGEYAAVARVFALGHLGAFPGGGVGSSPVAWWQLAGYTVLTQAFEREGSAVAAAREAMVVAAVASAALLWVLARRLDFPRWAATSAVVVVAVSPLAVSLQHGVLPENIAVVWLLAALVLVCDRERKPRLGKDFLVAALLLLAVLTSPVVLAATPAVAWLLVRRREAVRVVAVAVVFDVGLGLAFGPGARFLRPGLTGFGQDGLWSWLRVDPVFAGIGFAAIIAGLCVAKLRPIALGALLPLCLLVWPGAPLAGILTTILPLAALLVLGVVLAGLEARTQPAHRTTSGRPPFAVIIAACLVIMSTTTSWASGYTSLNLGSHAPEPLTQAGDWLRDNESGSRVLTDDASWAQLAAGGWPTGSLVLPSACTPACPAFDWVMARASSPALTSQLAIAEPAAMFGTGSGRVEIAKMTPSDDASPSPSPDVEQTARTNAGTILAASPRIKAGPDTAGLLRQGRVDARLLATIAAFAAFAATTTVQVVSLPGVDGEDAASQPRRQAVLAGDATTIAHFFTGQRDVFRPTSVKNVAGGVLVTYPPLCPAGLLTPFETS